MVEWDYKFAAATRELALLEEQASGLRTELLWLKREITLANRQLAGTKRQLLAVRLELVPARREFNNLQEKLSRLPDVQAAMPDAEMCEVNERLVLFALRAEAVINHLSGINHASHRDLLTDTPNRALMFDRLNTAIALARRNGTHIAILFLDLDHFKQINDALGHDIGDEVLQLVARRLEALVRDSDSVSRQGGDEFLVLLTEVAQASDAALIAAKMLYVLSAASHIGEHQLHLSTSIGIAVYPEDGEDADTLISKADAAMSLCKLSGRSGFEFYREEILNDSAPLALLPEGAKKAPYTRTLAVDGDPLTYLREANTQLVIAALTAQELEAKARAAHEQQLNIMATIAHELRNPLNPIRNAVGLLNHARTDDNMRLTLQAIIERQVIHMSRLVDDLLDGARLNSGKLSLQLQELELGDILNAAVDCCRSAIESRHQHLTFKPLTESLSIQGDPIRLTQVFSNLLDNASKYTPESGELSIAVERAADEVTITVADNGIGITAAALPHIFELFVQDAYGMALHNGGLGIGLAVVRNLVEAHQGSVSGMSAGLDTGSQFRVVLPIVSKP